MHPVTLLFLSLEERKSLAEEEARDRQHREVMATAKREAQEARRLAKAHAGPADSPVRAGRLAFLRRLVEPAPPCPDGLTD
jgi:hypothetical protein